MTDQVLDVLKIGLLCLLYLFFVRVLWTVWTEVRTASPSAGGTPNARAVTNRSTPSSESAATPAPSRAAPTQLTIIEPEQLFGTVHRIGHSLPIGRDVETGIQIADDNFVSGRHAKVSMIAGDVYVEDLGSRNGTFVNGARITTPTALRCGDRLQIGYTVLEAG